MRLCPKCEIVEVENRKGLAGAGFIYEREQKIIEEKFHMKLSALAIAIGIIWLLWTTIMVIWMQNFCEEKYDYEKGEFEGWEGYRRDSLLDEGPLGADCHYGGWQSPGEVRYDWEGTGMHFTVPGRW